MAALVDSSKRLLPLVELCESVLPLLPNKLVNETSRARIRNCALLFSPFLETTGLLFECFLKSTERVCDFHFESTLTPELLIALRDSLSESHWHETSHWNELSAFFERWALVEQRNPEE